MVGSPTLGLPPCNTAVLNFLYVGVIMGPGTPALAMAPPGLRLLLPTSEPQKGSWGWGPVTELQEASRIPVGTADALGGQNTEQRPRVAGASPRATLSRGWPQTAQPDPGASPALLLRWGEAVCGDGAGCRGLSSCSFSAESDTQKTSDGESSRMCWGVRSRGHICAFVLMHAGPVSTSVHVCQPM